MHFDIELRLESALEVHAAPAHHLVLGPVRPFLDELFEGLFLLGVQLWRSSGALAVCKARHAVAVVAMHPIAQGLAIHAASLGRRSPVLAFEHQSKRQNPAHHRRRLRRPRRSAKFARAQLHSRDRHTRHRPLSDSVALSSQKNLALGIPVESEYSAVGITRVRGRDPKGEDRDGLRERSLTASRTRPRRGDAQKAPDARETSGR